MERKVAIMDLEQKNNEEEKEITNPQESPEESVEETNAKAEELEVEKDQEEVQDVDAARQEEIEASEKEKPKTAGEPESEDVPEVEDEQPEVADGEGEAETLESMEQESDEETASAYYQRILNKIKETLESNDWGLIANEFSNLMLHIGEGPEPDKESKNILKEFEELRTDFEERKKAHYEELNKKREENLKKKKEILKQFADIINEENWTATKEVSRIKSNWERITQIPKDEIEPLNERFRSFLADFESHKVDRLVKKLQKEEENLTLKLLLLDKMDSLNAGNDKEDVDFESLSTEFDSLLFQWRKIGRVPNEKNQETWDRFNSAQDTFNEMRFKNDKEYRKKVEASLKKKKKLIAEAETLMDEESIAKAARRVNQLHKAWKKTGNLPQKDENELWEKFKAATDAFNDKKAENIDVLREQEQKNYDKKLELIEKAKELQDIEDFDKGHQSLQNLMSDWQKIGPVPRKKSSKVWKSFKETMDVFYQRRREHFKDRRGEEKKNLAAKKVILKKLEELASYEDLAKAVEEAKKLQAEFKDIGHVPIKTKNKIWKEYRKACDVIYERFRSSGSDLGMERKLISQGVEPANRKQVIKLQKEQNSLKKDISKLEAESIQYEEAKTYFKPTNKGNKLRDELQEKIEKTEKELEEKQSRLKDINKEVRTLMSGEEE